MTFTFRYMYSEKVKQCTLLIKKKWQMKEKQKKAIMKGKRQSQWFSFAKYTIFRYGLFKTRMVVTTPITDGCFWIAKTFFFQR